MFDEPAKPEVDKAVAALKAAQRWLETERERPGVAMPDEILRVIADALKPWTPAPPPRGLEFKRDLHGLVFTLTFHDGDGRAVEASWRGPDATVVMKAVGCEPNKKDRGCSSAAINSVDHASDKAQQVTELRLALEQLQLKVKKVVSVLREAHISAAAHYVASFKLVEHPQSRAFRRLHDANRIAEDLLLRALERSNVPGGTSA